MIQLLTIIAYLYIYYAYLEKNQSFYFLFII